MRSINENKRGSIYRAEVRQDPNRDLYRESRVNDQVEQDHIPSKEYRRSREKI